jgi:histone-lysine N-methyltransferase SETD3
MEFSDQIAIYVFFLMEYLKKEKSIYYPYIKTLPLDMSNFPHYFNECEKKLIKGSLLEKEINSQLNNFNKEYLKLIEIFRSFNYEDYMKIRLILGARLFETSNKERRVKIKNIFIKIFHLYLLISVV